MALRFSEVDWNHLCYFGRGYHEEQFSEIILNLDFFHRNAPHLALY